MALSHGGNSASAAAPAVALLVLVAPVACRSIRQDASRLGLLRRCLAAEGTLPRGVTGNQKEAMEMALRLGDMEARSEML